MSKGSNFKVMGKKEQWVDEVLRSFDNAKRAIPKDGLFNEIIAKIPNNKESKIIPLVHLTWIAAASIIIVIVNVYALKLQNDNIKNVLESRNNEIYLLSDYTF
ncbi:hypothetical protein [Aquimarina sp. AU119]|uniref:hypothetical protein n=1 Tax=Aquimarina sp. AU119 TaxID=2108528 RepID=UPI000D69D86A|nr:hypothetical protein [Aquimarina sp. AU119]